MRPMNIDLLIKMANQITDFWEGETGEEGAVTQVATHLRRYWEPRMRAQIVEYYEARQGAGLNDVAKKAVAVLAAQPRTAKAGPPVDKGVSADGDSKTPDAADPHGGDEG
jgi:formate dehydrogenase subunit delta